MNNQSKLSKKVGRLDFMRSTWKKCLAKVSQLTMLWMLRYSYSIICFVKLQFTFSRARLSCLGHIKNLRKLFSLDIVS